MECPYCHKPLTEVTNSRPTYHNSQVWRRRRCLNCENEFTTHEIINLSHLFVIKKSGKVERFSRMKLYAGISYAAHASKLPQRELFVDKITREVERGILDLKEKSVNTDQIADLVLKLLRVKSIATFSRFLTYCKDITTETQMKKELAKYLS